MAILRKAVLATLAGTALLAGCATGPYYTDGYGHGGYAPGYAPGYGYDGPVVYGPAYVGPSVGFGLNYSDQDYRHRDNRREWRGDNRNRDRDGRYDGRRDSEPYRQNYEPPGYRDRDGSTQHDRDRAANSASPG